MSEPTEPTLPRPYIVEVSCLAYLRFRVHAVSEEDAVELVLDGEGQNPVADHWEPLEAEHIQEVGRAEEFEE